ncbi:hypothetical protein [uncultured Roseivirga sp.]|uniref:hypothetical protein n=1 Tax=uncultured Roseivirga sp. TaxID=543088 RepID=UPI0030DCF261|tara:strand:+ start:5785 stop:6336 length:552 start_codon:yes stop_codon:yes gene_type:complete
MSRLEGEIRYSFFTKRIEIPFGDADTRVFKIKTKCFSNNLAVQKDNAPIQYFKFENTNFRKRIYRLITTFENEEVVIEYNHKATRITTKINGFNFEVICHSYMQFTLLESSQPFGIIDNLSYNLITYRDNYCFLREFDKDILCQLILYTYMCSSVLNVRKMNDAYGNGTTSFPTPESVRGAIF